MRGRQPLINVVLAGLLCAVTAGCGDAAEGTNAAFVANTSANNDVGSGGRPDSIPETVTVTQPTLVDTSVRPADLPVWPGPDPSEFLVPNPPVGEIGQLTGVQAGEVFVAAQNNPGEFWNVGGMVLWLVVT